MNPWFFADVLGFLGAACFVSVSVYQMIQSRRMKKMMSRTAEAGATPQLSQKPTEPTTSREADPSESERKAPPTGERKIVLLWASAVTLAILFGLLVWPTLYRHDHMTMRGGSDYPVRINRITGRTQILYPEGWAEPRTISNEPARAELQANDLGKLESRAWLQGPEGSWDIVTLKVYNGSEIALTEVTVEITVGSSWKRPYRMWSEFGKLEPLRVGNFHANLGFGIKASDQWNYRIVAARGYR